MYTETYTFIIFKYRKWYGKCFPALIELAVLLNLWKENISFSICLYQHYLLKLLVILFKVYINKSGKK